MLPMNSNSQTLEENKNSTFLKDLGLDKQFKLQCPISKQYQKILLKDWLLKHIIKGP